MEECTKATQLSRSEFVRRAILLEDGRVERNVRTGFFELLEAAPPQMSIATPKLEQNYCHPGYYPTEPERRGLDEKSSLVDHPLVGLSQTT